SQATLYSTEVSLVAEVALNYVEVRAFQARLAIARDNLASQSETLQLTRGNRYYRSFIDHWGARSEASVAAQWGVRRARDTFSWGDYRFEVVDMDGNRIDKVIVPRAGRYTMIPAAERNQERSSCR
ncbi:MAG: hypothetical protein ACXWCP_32440, partial [Burkholderiales bacterium]